MDGERHSKRKAVEHAATNAVTGEASKRRLSKLIGVSKTRAGTRIMLASQRTTVREIDERIGFWVARHEFRIEAMQGMAAIEFDWACGCSALTDRSGGTIQYVPCVPHGGEDVGIAFD